MLLCCITLSSSSENQRSAQEVAIAHSFIWLPISFVPPHRKQLIELNCMPYIAHATKI